MSLILIASAGTGGHIFPALALADEIKKLSPETQIVFIRCGRQRFEESPNRNGTETLWIPGAGMPRGFSLKLISFALQTARGLIASLRIVKRFRPDVVVGFGNFGSYAPIKASAYRKIPVFLHEANSIPGKANKVLAKYSSAVGVNFPDTARFFNGYCVETVGMPVRKDFLNPPDRKKAAEYFAIDDSKLTLLVTGGSQGARRVNETICNILPALQSRNIQIIHLTGREDFDKVKGVYSKSTISHSLKPFEDKMKYAFDASDIVVSRAGASSIAEITLTGKPAILIPYPYATENHQFHNAKYLEEKGAAILIPDHGLTPENLLEQIIGLAGDEKRRMELSRRAGALAVRDSSERMAQMVLGMSRKRSHEK